MMKNIILIIWLLILSLGVFSQTETRGNFNKGLNVVGNTYVNGTTQTDSLSVIGNTNFGGDIIYEDTFWDDLRVPAVTSKTGVTLHPPFDYDSLAMHFTDSGIDTGFVYLSYQIPHRWKEGTDIYFHIHWHQTNVADSVNFHIYYKRLNLSGDGDAVWTELNCEWGAYLTYGGEDGFVQLTTFPAIDMTGFNGSDQILIKCSTVVASAASTLNDIYVYDFDLHYEINKPGSYTASPD